MAALTTEFVSRKVFKSALGAHQNEFRATFPTKLSCFRIFSLTFWAFHFASQSKEGLCLKYVSIPDFIFQADIGGRRLTHGRASSSCAASRKSVASSPKGPANCTPMGILSLFQNNGTDMAGCPVLFWIRVKATKERVASSHFIGFSGVGLKASSLVGGMHIVGDKSRS